MLPESCMLPWFAIGEALSTVLTLLLRAEIVTSGWEKLRKGSSQNPQSRNPYWSEDQRWFKHITFYFGDPTVWLGLRGLQRPEIKRKVVTARRGDVTRVNKRLQKQDGWRKRMDGKPETEQMDGDGQRQLSLSIHPVFYLTRQPFHALCKERKKVTFDIFWISKHPFFNLPVPHLVEPLSSDSIACADVPRLVHQPLQPEGLWHFYAGHCVPGKSVWQGQVWHCMVSNDPDLYWYYRSDPGWLAWH